MANTRIPIIIVHTGDSFYLSPVLKQMRLFNPHSDIFLISDASTKGYTDVTHVDIEQYMEEALEFEKRYIHLSSNPYFYELICFQRWFIILNFVRKNNINDFLCMDSDVLLYCNVDETFANYIGCDYTICNKVGPGCSLFNIRSLEKFCNYINYLYTDESSKKELNDFYQPFITENRPGGFCDMMVFSWYQERMSPNVIDLVFPNEGVCFDGCITESAGFKMKNGLKEIYWKDNRPYGKLLKDDSLIRLNCLHFQGRTKYSMYKYLLNEKKERKTGLLVALQWFFSKRVMSARLKAIKKRLIKS